MGCNSNSNIPIILTRSRTRLQRRRPRQRRSQRRRRRRRGWPATTRPRRRASQRQPRPGMRPGAVSTLSSIWRPTQSSDQINDSFFSGKRCWKTESERWRRRKLGTKMTWWSSCSWWGRRWRWKWSKWSVREQKYLWSTKVLVNYQGGEFIQFSLKI